LTRTKSRITPAASKILGSADAGDVGPDHLQNLWRCGGRGDLVARARRRSPVRAPARRGRPPTWPPCPPAPSRAPPPRPGSRPWLLPAAPPGEERQGKKISPSRAEERTHPIGRHVGEQGAELGVERRHSRSVLSVRRDGC
jgi:hypothetical protein